jgi:hypothetical protein
MGANEVIGANYTVTTTFFKAIIDCLAQISIVFIKQVCLSIINVIHVIYKIIAYDVI